MTLITKGMGAIIKSGSKKTLTTSQAHKVSKIKEKLISKIVSGPRKAYKKKFGKEPTFKMKNPITGKSKTCSIRTAVPYPAVDNSPNCPTK